MVRFKLLADMKIVYVKAFICLGVFLKTHTPLPLELVEIMLENFMIREMVAMSESMVDFSDQMRALIEDHTDQTPLRNLGDLRDQLYRDAEPQTDQICVAFDFNEGGKNKI